MEVGLLVLAKDRWVLITGFLDLRSRAFSGTNFTIAYKKIVLLSVVKYFCLPKKVGSSPLRCLWISWCLLDAYSFPVLQMGPNFCNEEMEWHFKVRVWARRMAKTELWPWPFRIMQTALCWSWWKLCSGVACRIRQYQAGERCFSFFPFFQTNKQ